MYKKTHWKHFCSTSDFNAKCQYSTKHLLTKNGDIVDQHKWVLLQWPQIIWLLRNKNDKHQMDSEYHKNKTKQKNNIMLRSMVYYICADIMYFTTNPAAADLLFS